MGALRNVFDSGIPLGLKLKIYKTAICSLLTYGCEAWTLTEREDTDHDKRCQRAALVDSLARMRTKKQAPARDHTIWSEQLGNVALSISDMSYV